MKEYKRQAAAMEVQFASPPLLKDLQAKAKARGLWNLFLPENSGVSVLEYAPIAELLGGVPLANAAMNCSAPDTGNMEVLEKFGTQIDCVVPWVDRGAWQTGHERESMIVAEPTTRAANTVLVR